MTTLFYFNVEIILYVLGFGVVNKIVFEFDQVFWPQSTEYFIITPSSYSDRGMMSLWLNFYQVVGRPVIMTFTLGPNAIPSESLTDDQIKTLGNAHFCV